MHVGGVPSGSRVRPGDEVLYLGHSRTVRLMRWDGTASGIELRGGVATLTDDMEAAVEEEWPRAKTLAVASSLARQAGLEGRVEHVEGSVSSVHRVRILG